MPHRSPARPLRVLFLCAGDAGLGPMAMRLLDRHGAGRFVACSAGPAAPLHPCALQVMREQDLPTEDPTQISMARLVAAPPFDFAFTLCTRSERETWPPLPGAPLRARWSVPDPLRATGHEATLMVAFREAFAAIERRVRLLASLRLEALGALALQARIEQIGSGEPELPLPGAALRPPRPPAGVLPAA